MAIEQPPWVKKKKQLDLAIGFVGLGGLVWGREERWGEEVEFKGGESCIILKENRNENRKSADLMTKTWGGEMGRGKRDAKPGERIVVMLS